MSDRVLWRARCGDQVLQCLLISCCTGAELQLVDGECPILRELYPDKSTLYERARNLIGEYRAEGFAILDFDAGVR
jgi:hypothetical protein